MLTVRFKLGQVIATNGVSKVSAPLEANVPGPLVIPRKIELGTSTSPRLTKKAKSRPALKAKAKEKAKERARKVEALPLLRIEADLKTEGIENLLLSAPFRQTPRPRLKLKLNQRGEASPPQVKQTGLFASDGLRDYALIRIAGIITQAPAKTSTQIKVARKATSANLYITLTRSRPT